MLQQPPILPSLSPRSLHQTSRVGLENAYLINNIIVSMRFSPTCPLVHINFSNDIFVSL